MRMVQFLTVSVASTIALVPRLCRKMISRKPSARLKRLCRQRKLFIIGRIARNYPKCAIGSLICTCVIVAGELCHSLPYREALY